MIDIDYNFYCTTHGCYVISDVDNMVVAYKCFKDNHEVIDLNGDSLYVKYATGDLQFLLSFASSDIKWLLFERLVDKNKLKCYNFVKIRDKIINYSNK